MPTDFVIEFLTEELPPLSLPTFANFFAQGLFARLCEQGFCSPANQYHAIATPRRFGLWVESISTHSPSRVINEKLLPQRLGYEPDGAPSATLQKKLAQLEKKWNQSLSIDRVRVETIGNEPFLTLSAELPGVSLEAALQSELPLLLERLPIAKQMQYQAPNGQTFKFIRPVRNILALHGQHLLALSAFGLNTRRITKGHRFLSAEITIDAAENYLQLLRDHFVEPLFITRRNLIEQQLAKHALLLSAQVKQPESLLDEVCALVEWPTVYACHFDPVYLTVPQECLILTMQQNQRYFVLLGKNERLLPSFLIVSNIVTDDPKAIISGNEKVVRPRLADAAFFYEQDKKQPLEHYVNALKTITHHQGLGSVYQRCERIALIAESLQKAASFQSFSIAHLQRTSFLCKADLSTQMVGEFPELQGTIGAYYALAHHESNDLAQAVGEHYRPAFAGDALPASSLGKLMALADKLEALLGYWGMGVRPSGEKDPFSLRRLSLGIIRLLLDNPIDLSTKDLFSLAAKAFSAVDKFSLDTTALCAFFTDRLRQFLKDQGANQSSVQAILSLPEFTLSSIPVRLDALDGFLKTESALALIGAHRRINNILSKNLKSSTLFSVDNSVDVDLLNHPVEQSLWNNFISIRDALSIPLANHDYVKVLTGIMPLCEPINLYLDQVMVFVEDAQIKNNRLVMLFHVRQLLNFVADLSFLATELSSTKEAC